MIKTMPGKLADAITLQAMRYGMTEDYADNLRSWVKVLIRETMKDEGYVDRIRNDAGR